DPKFTTQGNDGEMYHIFPMRKFSFPVDKQHVLATKAALPGDEIVNELQLDLSGKNYLLRGDLLILALVATTNFERPVCFTSSSGISPLGLDKYVRQEGMIYRLVPVLNKNETPNVNVDAAYTNMMQKFRYGAANKKDIY